ncbi:MAG: hypothetical protein ACI4OY_06655 [Aristaeellaceae bacterium]
MIDKPVHVNADVHLHPRTAMDKSAGFLTSRPLRVQRIAELPV